jgi:hypothetical protein
MLYLHTADNSVKRKSALLTLSRRNSAFLEAFGVVSVSDWPNLALNEHSIPLRDRLRASRSQLLRYVALGTGDSGRTPIVWLDKNCCMILLPVLS